MMITFATQPVVGWAQDSEATPDPDRAEVMEALTSRLADIDRALRRDTAFAPLHWERLRVLYAISVADEERIEAAEHVAHSLEDLATDSLTRTRAAAYLGALEVIRAKHAFLPTSKVSHVRRGLRTLDAAVNAHPSDIEIRNLRLLSTFYLPFFFRRGDSAREDLRTLAELLPQDPFAMPPEATLGVLDFVLENGELIDETVASLHATRAMIVSLSPPPTRRRY